MSSDNEFETGDAGAGLTYPVQAGNLKKNSHIVINGHPCKVLEISVAKTGKHGHAKANISAVCILTGKKMEDSCPSSHNVDAPFIKKYEGELVDIDEEGFCSYMDEKGEIKEIPLPTDGEDYVEELKKANADGKNIMISIIEAMGQSKVVAFRETRESEKK